MFEIFQIWVDRLKQQGRTSFEGRLPPTFLEIEEEELTFLDPVEVKGEAYLADEELILCFDAKAVALMPCAICNGKTKFEIVLKQVYHAESLSEVKGAVFDCSQMVREAILIELPHYVECSGGKCPERVKIAPYLTSSKKQEETTYYPFKNLDPS